MIITITSFAITRRVVNVKTGQALIAALKAIFLVKLLAFNYNYFIKAT